jgi:hypothetical protein
MPLYYIEFKEDGEERSAGYQCQGWIVSAPHDLSREVAGEIVRSVCQPHNFSTVSFTVYELTPNVHNAVHAWQLYTPDNIDGRGKKLFSMTALSVDDMLNTFKTILAEPEIEWDITDSLRSDLLDSLRANTKTIKDGLKSLGQYPTHF